MRCGCAKRTKDAKANAIPKTFVIVIVVVVVVLNYVVIVLNVVVVIVVVVVARWNSLGLLCHV